jgi:hypothetical protein
MKVLMKALMKVQFLNYHAYANFIYTFIGTYRYTYIVRTVSALNEGVLEVEVHKLKFCQSQKMII